MTSIYNKILYLIVKKGIKSKHVHKVIKFFRDINETNSVLIVLHVPEGGDTNDCARIVNAIQHHLGTITVFVPEVAISTGSQIALSGDTLIMGKNACLSPFDDQLDSIPAKELLKIKKALEKPKSKKHADLLGNISLSLEDYTNVMESETMLKLTEKEIKLALKPKYKKKQIKKILDAFLYHKKYHDCPLFVKELTEIGIEVTTCESKELYNLFDSEYEKVFSRQKRLVDYQEVSNSQ